LAQENTWIKIEATISTYAGFWDSYLSLKYISPDSIKSTDLSLQDPLSNPNSDNSYECYFKFPENINPGKISVQLKTESFYEGYIKSLSITKFSP